MNVHDLVSLYGEKSNEELLLLAEQLSLLTVEAQTALASELSRRRLHSAQASLSGRARTVEQQSPDVAKLSAREIRTCEFIQEVLVVYRKNRWVFIKLIFPAVLFTALGYVFRQHQVHEIEKHLPRGVAVLQHKMEILEIGLLTWGSFLVSWILFSFSFGAICVATEQIEVGLGATVAESFNVTCTRVWPFIRLCVLLFVLMIITTGGLLLAGSGLAIVLRQYFGTAADLGVWLTGYFSFGVGTLVLSRFSLAVPGLILDDYPLNRAIRHSVEATQGKWTILSALLVKSVVGGYIAGMLLFWIARWTLTGIPLPPWSDWLLAAASLLAVTVVEPVMFIGFALLYLKTCPPTAGTEAQAATV